jgi:hypothetical protein
MKVTGKRKKNSAGPLNATRIESKQNKKKNCLVKEARDSLADWRNAVYTPLHGDYPSQSERRMKHKAVTDAALRMHAAFKAGVKKTTPYLHVACKHTANYLKRDVTTRSAEGHEHGNKELKQEGENTSGHAITEPGTIATHPVPLTILRAVAAKKEAEAHVAMPLTDHARRLAEEGVKERMIEVDK